MPGCVVSGIQDADGHEVRTISTLSDLSNPLNLVNLAEDIV